MSKTQTSKSNEALLKFYIYRQNDELAEYIERILKKQTSGSDFNHVKILPIAD